MSHSTENKEHRNGPSIGEDVALPVASESRGQMGNRRTSIEATQSGMGLSHKSFDAAGINLHLKHLLEERLKNTFAFINHSELVNAFGKDKEVTRKLAELTKQNLCHVTAEGKRIIIFFQNK